MGDQTARSLRADQSCHGEAETGRQREPVPSSQAIIIGQTTFEVIIKLFIMRRSDEFYAEKVSTRQNCRRCRGLENGQS
jgi:hypothetical protein